MNIDAHSKFMDIHLRFSSCSLVTELMVSCMFAVHIILHIFVSGNVSVSVINSVSFVR